jgi:hypothetical protein
MDLNPQVVAHNLHAMDHNSNPMDHNSNPMDYVSLFFAAVSLVEPFISLFSASFDHVSLSFPRQSVRLQLHTTRTLVSQLLAEKMVADYAADTDPMRGPHSRQSMSEFTFDFFVVKFQSPTMARVHLSAFTEVVQV